MSKLLHYSEGIVTKKNIFENLNAVNPDTNELKNPPQPVPKTKKPRKKRAPKSKENSANDVDNTINEEDGNEEKENSIQSVEGKEELKETGEINNEESAAPVPLDTPPTEDAPSSNPSPVEPCPSSSGPPEAEEPANTPDQETPVQPSAPMQSYPRYGYPTMQFVNSSFKRKRTPLEEERSLSGQRGRGASDYPARGPASDRSYPPPYERNRPSRYNNQKPLGGPIDERLNRTGRPDDRSNAVNKFNGPSGNKPVRSIDEKTNAEKSNAPSNDRERPAKFRRDRREKGNLDAVKSGQINGNVSNSNPPIGDQSSTNQSVKPLDTNHLVKPLKDVPNGSEIDSKNVGSEKKRNRNRRDRVKRKSADNASSKLDEQVKESKTEQIEESPTADLERPLADSKSGEETNAEIKPVSERNSLDSNRSSPKAGKEQTRPSDVGSVQSKPGVEGLDPRSGEKLDDNKPVDAKPEVQAGRPRPPRNNHGGRRYGRSDEREGKFPEQQKKRDGNRYSDQKDRDGRYPEQQRERDGNKYSDQKDRDSKYPEQRMERDGNRYSDQKDRDSKYPEQRRERDGNRYSDQKDRDSKYPEQQRDRDGNRYSDQKDRDSKYPEQRRDRDGNRYSDQKDRDGRYPEQQRERDGNKYSDQKDRDSKYPEQQRDRDGNRYSDQKDRDGRYPQQQRERDGNRYSDQKDRDGRYPQQQRERDGNRYSDQKDRDGRYPEQQRDRDDNRSNYNRPPPRKYYDGYRRSFDSDSHPPPPRRGRGGNTYSSSRYSGERKPYEEKSHEESHDKGQKVATVEGNNANNSHHQLNGHLSEDDRRGVSTGDMSAPKESSGRNRRNRNGRGNSRGRGNTREIASRDPSSAEPEHRSADGTQRPSELPPALLNGSAEDNTRDANGKTKKWSDESWQDDAPRKPSPYEEQTNRVKVTHEPVEIITSPRAYNQTVQEVQGDLMGAPAEYSLAIGVSEDFRMPSGLQAQFRNEFRRLDTLLDQNIKVGGVACLGPPVIPGSRHIFYLVHKRVSHVRSTTKALHSCFMNLREACTKRGVQFLALPQFGNGADKLDWREVRPLLDQVFEASSINVLIYIQNEDHDYSKTVKPTGAKLMFEPKPVVEIEEFTSIVVLSSIDRGLNSLVLDSLNGKFSFMSELDSQLSSASLGSVICIKRANYFINIFIVALTAQEPFKFETIFKCLQSYKKHLNKDRIEYVAFEVLAERHAGNEMLNEKLVSFMKNSLLYSIQLHVCWPDYVDDRHAIARMKPTNQSAPPSRIEYNGRYPSNPTNQHGNGAGFHGNAFSSNQSNSLEIDSNQHFPKL